MSVFFKPHLLCVLLLVLVGSAYGSWLSNLVSSITGGSTKSNYVPQVCTRRTSVNKNSSSTLPKCALSVDQLTSGRALPGSSAQPTPFPSWMNLTLARIGQEFAIANKFAITISALTGLISGLPFPDARDVLAFTGGSDTNQKAAKRYLATATQMYVWFDQLLKTDVIEENEVFLTSIANVRALHIDAAAKANAAPKPMVNPHKYDNVTTDETMWAAFAADLAASNFTIRNYTSLYTQYNSNSTAINQFIQGVTLIGFSGYAVMDPAVALIHDYTEEQLAGYLHFWAIVGYAVGLEDDFNVMLQPDVATARAYFYEIQHKFVIPAFFNIDQIGKVMVEALLEGYNVYVPNMGMRPIMYRLLRDYFKIPAPHMKEILKLTDEAAQTAWDTVFVPLTYLKTQRALVNAALDTGIETFIVALFGPYTTDDEKVVNVYYPTLPH